MAKREPDAVYEFVTSTAYVTFVKLGVEYSCPERTGSL